MQISNEKRKAKALIGRAVVYGHIAKATELQGKRVLSLFNPTDRRVEIPEFNAEIYQFLLCVNQLTKLLASQPLPRKQFLVDVDLENAKQLRNIWEHSHPSRSRLFKNWKPHNKDQEEWLEMHFPGSWPEVYSIDVDDTDVKIAGLLSVKTAIQEAEFWVSISEKFDDPALVWFPGQDT